MREGRKTEVHKHCVCSTERRDGGRECEGVCVYGREKERETVVMIDARLPPLCSSEWLQQKAQNNIPDSLLRFFFPLSLHLS